MQFPSTSLPNMHQIPQHHSPAVGSRNFEWSQISTNDTAQSSNHSSMSSSDSAPRSASASCLSDDTLTQAQTPDMNIRKCMSDSALRRGVPTVYNRKNTAFMLISRSGGPMVKQIIHVVLQRCDQALTSAGSTEVPLEECTVLAHFASDAYYKAVIAGRQGIPALVRAMKTWPHERGLQECCCLALSSVCVNGSNLDAIEETGAVSAIIQAMKYHANSIAVQSAACDALRNMSGLILALTKKEQIQHDLEGVLQHASGLYLLPSHRRIADALLALVQGCATRI